MKPKNAQKFIHANVSSCVKPQEVVGTLKEIGMIAKLFTLSNCCGTPLIPSLMGQIMV